jgi:hypothetical protein
MLILLMLALAASDSGAKATPPLLRAEVALMVPGPDSWFRPGVASFGSSVTVGRAERPLDAPTADTSSEMICTIRVLKPDPKFDARIARPAPPDLDPKIVRPSPCKK